MALPHLKQSLRDVILGGQDGLVNVLGVVLGVAAATNDVRIIIISGLAATFAESISMAAVAYTSEEAQASQYQSDVASQEQEVANTPSRAESDVRAIFKKWGFEGDLLEQATKKITSTKENWVNFMLSEELRVSKDGIDNPILTSFVVGTASFAGSFVPITAFFLIPNVTTAMYVSVAVSSLFLFALGFVKAKVTVGSPLKSGIKIMVIGMASALTGYVIGKILGSATF